MITKIITENQTQIQEAIRTNGEGAITGEILQEKMLLLNRDLFGGQIEYDTHLLLADVEDAVANMKLPIDSDLFNFFKEWYNDGTWQNNYIALYGNRNGASIILGYMRISLGDNGLGEDRIICYLLGCESNLLKFVISPESSDMEDNHINEIKYRGEPRVLAMRLPSNSQTTYPDWDSMLEALGISTLQWDELESGKYVFVVNATYTPPRLFPIQICYPDRVVLGYTISEAEMGISWELVVDAANDLYEIYCYDNQ